jgi:transposase
LLQKCPHIEQVAFLKTQIIQKHLWLILKQFIVIADNTTFHKGGRIKELIEAAECQLKYLPPYSPDLNKIQRCWSWLKSRIRKQLIQFDCLWDAMEDVLRTAS